MLAMERSDYYKHLDESVQDRYNEKLKIIDDKDPYLLKDFSVDLHHLIPEVTLIDLVNYLILSHKFYTGQQMKAYKGLSAYKYYEAGLVQEVKAKKMNGRSFVVVGKVSISLCII